MHPCFGQAASISHRGALFVPGCAGYMPQEDHTLNDLTCGVALTLSAFVHFAFSRSRCFAVGACGIARTRNPAKTRKGATRLAPIHKPAALYG